MIGGWDGYNREKQRKENDQIVGFLILLVFVIVVIICLFQ